MSSGSTDNRCVFAIVFLIFRNNTNCFLLLLKSLASAKKAIVKNYLPFITKFLIALDILKCTKILKTTHRPFPRNKL